MTKAEKAYSSGEIVFTQENEYNQDGIRISKKEGSSAKYYYYDRGSVASTKSGSDITSCNVIGIEGNAIGTVRDEENIEKYYVYNKDIQGSTISITAEDGSIAASYDYSDFGVATERQESSIENEICYTGAIYDATTSLYYMNARYYDLSIGRFISEDTYRGEDNDYDQWHLYAYCANNPINYVDPSGHYAYEATIRMYQYAYTGKGKSMDVTSNKIGKALTRNFINGVSFKLKLLEKIKKKKKKGNFLLKNFGFEYGNTNKYDSDMRYSIGHATIYVEYKKKKFKANTYFYEVKISLKDRYDFAKFSKEDAGFIKRQINNIGGYVPQKLGALHPYSWNYSKTSTFLIKNYLIE